MRSIRSVFLTGGALALALLPGRAAAASTTGPTATAAAAASATVAHWAMEEGPGATRLVDSSGNGLHGTIGRDVATGSAVGGDRVHRFAWKLPDAPPANPHRLNTVADRPLLDPGSGAYSVSLRFRATHHSGNIVQKGQATTPGGSWKIDAEDGVLHCQFRGASGTRTVSSGRNVMDGRWHTVRCERSGNTLTLTVDGAVTQRRTGATGRIDNSHPVSIGGKHSCNQASIGCDYFSGDIAWVRVESDRVVK